MARKGVPLSEEEKAKRWQARWSPEARARRENRLALKADESEAAMSPEVGESEDVMRIPLPEPHLDDLLTDAEINEIRLAAREKALKEQKEERRRAYAVQALADAKRSLGSMPEDEAWKDDMKTPTRIFVEMPRLRKPTGGELPPEPIIIDQNIYTSGKWYTVPKGQAVYMRYLMDQAIRHVNQVDGRSRSFFNAGSWQVEWQGGPAAGGGLGPSFDGIHKRQS